MTIDILFLAKNRLEFTRQSLAALLANTNWSLVRRMVMVDDCSTEHVRAEFICWSEKLGAKTGHYSMTGPAIPCLLDKPDFTTFGAPAAVMNTYAADPDAAEAFVKIDNDVILPPRWLDQCAAVMEAHPELDLLGIEPPASRVPSREGMMRSPTPELGGRIIVSPETPATKLYDGLLGYAPADSIGGIGLMRTRCFLQNEPIKPHSTYGGFTEFQIAHPKIVKGWIVPPLKCFLLDRLPEPKWASLSREYEAKGWQRSWGRYPMSAREDLWGWWEPVGQEARA